MQKVRISQGTCAKLSPPAWPWASKAAKSWDLMATAKTIRTSATTLLPIFPPFTFPSLPSLVSHPWQEVWMSSSVGIFCCNNAPGFRETDRLRSFEGRDHQYPTVVKLPMVRIEIILSLMMCIYVGHFELT